MTKQIWVFCILLIINFIIACLYLLWGFIFRKDKDGRKQYIFNFVVMLLCPIAGIVYFFIGTCIRHIFLRREVDLAEDIFFSKERVKADERANEESERNIVPMVDALAVSDTANLRSYMLNVLTRDVTNSLSSIAEALNSDDSETAHYAAAVLSDRLGEFRSKVYEMYSHIKKLHEMKDPPKKIIDEKCESIRVLVVYMESILSQNVFTPIEQDSYTRIMSEICDILYEERPSLLTIEFYDNAIIRLIAANEFEKAEILSGRALNDFPNELSSYVLSLRLYFALKDRDKFNEVLERLKTSKIAMDGEAREIIKMYES